MVALNWIRQQQLVYDESGDGKAFILVSSY
jgi:hypothetical protein